MGSIKAMTAIEAIEAIKGYYRLWELL